ncbi:MAG: ribose-phosphate diphosphokinase [Candidatus Kapaibacteriota bacterium]
MSDLMIVSGRSNKTLADNIARSLGRELSPVTIRNFSDGEIWVKYEDNIRGNDLFIIQSTNAPAEHLMELLIMIDAAKRASAKRITAVIPYFAYARQDRKDQPRVSITAKLIANLLTEAGADRVITMDLHTPQIQGFFDIPLDHLYGSTVLVKKLFDLRSDQLAIASPDVGGIKTARTYAKVLDADLVVVDKRRPAHNVAEVMNIIGEVSGKDIIVIDDLIDTGTTFVKCSEALVNAGARSITGVCTHGVFSGSAIDKINKSDAIKTVYVTDTFPNHWESEKIVTVSVAELFGEAIERTHNNASISSLFDIIR